MVYLEFAFATLSMLNNHKTTLGQKFTAQMSHRLAQQAASSSGKQKSPGSGFKPNQVNK